MMSVDEARRARLMSGEAWDDFCDQLKAAGRIVARETAGGDPQDAVEGYRYLTRMLMMGNFRVIERRTPGTKPRFIGLIPPPLKGGIGVQSPNQDHIVQPVDARYRYRITDTAADVYTHLSAWSPPIPDDVGAVPVGLDAEGHLETFNPNMALTPHTLVLGDIANADGTVDFILSVDPPDDGSAWMSMAPTTRELMGRVVWDDRNEQTPPRLVIECLDEHEQPETPSPEDMAERLAVAGQLILGQKADYEGWTNDLLTRENDTHFTREWYERIGGSPDDRHFEFGYWRVPEGWRSSSSSRRCRRSTGISSCATTGWRTSRTTPPARATSTRRTRCAMARTCASSSPTKIRACRIGSSLTPTITGSWGSVSCDPVASPWSRAD